ncbi:hypothetical protein [Shimia sagamensis]|uniref:Uncharacterized protein n=1 Tax=Shimia sagamensis TaxID=1566352 RepID=A0ABY1NML0_9RHOB|nr:hypothetical protein [Shimia sagamensis]SMP13263.1 hypothetical protein SAMN06265373_102467 [Shimia sagamensis]
MQLHHIAALGFFALAAPVLAEDRVAEDQTPTGKFLTAGEVRPILDATKTSWIGVREFDGQDLVYFTHLLAWRCGLYEVQYSINDGAAEVFPIPECPPDIENAMAIPEDTQIFVTQPLGSVETVDVTLLYDDLGTDVVQYKRAAVLMP